MIKKLLSYLFAWLRLIIMLNNIKTLTKCLRYMCLNRYNYFFYVGIHTYNIYGDIYLTYLTNKKFELSIAS